MSVIKAIQTYGEGLHSGSLLQLASAAATIHMGRNGKVVNGIEGALSCATTGFTTPVWLVKDLALNPTCAPKSRMNLGELVKLPDERRR